MPTFSNTPFGLLIIGDEILSGRRRDKHLEQAIKILAKRDLQLAWVHIVGDDFDLLTQEFRDILRYQRPCFSFGGIGATVDDRTRQAMSAALEKPLIRHPEAVKEIESQYGEQAYPQRITMAELPEDAVIIPNPYNRVPGFSIRHVHCLPGFPEMAWPMMEWVLDNCYQHIERSPIIQHSFLLYGAQESELAALLEQFQNQFPKVKISSLPRLAGKQKQHVEIGVQGMATDVEQAEQSIVTTLEKLDYSPVRAP